MSSIQSIRELTEPLLAEAGLQLWDVEIGQGVVRILVERADGVDLDALTRASQVLSGVLDEHPDVAPDGPYQLEVSSPGVERTLRSVEQYQRFVGEAVNIRLTGPVDGQRRWRGTLVAADADGVTIAPDETTPAGEGEGTVSFRYEQIERARTVLVWGSPSGQGGGKGRNSKAGGSPRRSDTRRQGRAGRAGRSGNELKESS